MNRKLIIKRAWPMLMCVGLPIHAQNKTNICDRGDITQSEINHCTADEATNLDKKLNEVYLSLLNSVSGDKNLTLQIRSAERDWVRFRDSFIQAAFPASGPHAEHGSMLPTEINDLRSKLTNEHIEHLAYLKRLYTGL